MIGDQEGRKDGYQAELGNRSGKIREGIRPGMGQRIGGSPANGLEGGNETRS
jgi:hypothetical protein